MVWIAVTCAGVLIYLVALVATMPASALAQFATIPPQVTALYGTLRHGRATLEGGYVLDWDHRAMALLRGRAAADVTLTGADTALEARARVTPTAVRVRDLTGRAGAGLLGLAPGLSLQGCTPRAVVDVPALTMTRDMAGAQGTIRSDAGTCTEESGRVTEVPALDVDLSTVGADAQARVRTGETELATVTLRGDRVLGLVLQPEGSVLIPGLPTGAPIRLELPF